MRGARCRHTVGGVAAVILTIGLLSLVPQHLWQLCASFVVDHWLPVVLLIAGAVGAALWLGPWWRRQGDERGSVLARPLRPISPWIVGGAGAAVVAAAIIALRVLLAEADAALPADRPALRIDAIKTSLTVAAGVGGAAALLLAARRQWLSERTQGHTELDASERRVTELYTRAVEQLGSSRAAVRLGGLYALERVAQDNPQHRQTVVDVLSAYLRMPTTTATDDPLGHENVGESQVRVAAQRILTSHLRNPPGSSSGYVGPTAPYWPGIRLDLAGSTLLNWNFEFGKIRQASFRSAVFEGHAIFTGAAFIGGADFSGAVFRGDARFDNAQVDGTASFQGAVFDGDAVFGHTTFAGPTSFGCAVFHRPVNFGWAQFRRAAAFDCVSFNFGRVNFEYVRMDGEVWFDHAQIDGSGVRFWRTRFGDVATFCGIRGSSELAFLGSTFEGPVGFEATYGVSRIRFVDTAVLAGGDRSRDVWPEGWDLVDHHSEDHLRILHRRVPSVEPPA